MCAIVQRWRAAATGLAVGIAMLDPAAGTEAHAQQVSYTGGVYTATGRYLFDQQATSASLSSGLLISAGPLSLSASVPLIAQNTPWVSVVGIGPLPTGGPMHGTVADSTGRQARHGRRISLPEPSGYDQIGVGDPVVWATVDALGTSMTPVSVRLTGAAKAPLGDESQGFGTGSWDYGAGLGASVMRGDMLLSADATYWWLGDLPDLELVDALSYAVSAGRLLRGGRIAGSLTIGGATSAIEGEAAPLQAGAGVTWRARSGRTIGLNAAVGLSDTAPDFSAMVGWSVPLRRVPSAK